MGTFCFGVPERNLVDCNPVSAAISKAAGQWARFLWLSTPARRACVCLQGLLAHSYLQLVRENAHSFLALLRVAMPRAVLWILVPEISLPPGTFTLRTITAHCSHGGDLPTAPFRGGHALFSCSVSALRVCGMPADDFRLSD